MLYLNKTWRSERLICADLEIADIQSAQKIYETSSNTLNWDGRVPDPNYINQCFASGDLPPEGKKEDYRLQTIRLNTKERELIGILSIYHGYPLKDSVYLAFLCIGNKYKSQGFGQELIYQLTNELNKLQFKEIRINVALKNWSALRFWTKVGFDQVNGVFGDKEYSDNTYASIELTKKL